MNFLAHIFLSNGEEDVLIGNFMADFITNREVDKLSPSIQKGVKLHRMIDSFTDEHPVVRAGSRRLRPTHGKYSPVVIDILFDYILARNWTSYNDISLSDFSNQSYNLLQNRIDDFPHQLSQRIPLMIADNFLLKYGTKEGLLRALSSMDRRTKFPSNFVAALDQLEEEYDLFDEEFNTFFPELIEVCKDFLEI